MKPVKLVCGMCDQIVYDHCFDYIGVDKGAWQCFVQNIPMIACIGDFDSITTEQLERLKQYAHTVVLPKHKNETDSEAAIALAKELGYRSIYLNGVLGGRLDHTLANVALVCYRDDDLVIEDETHYLFRLKKGTYQIPKRFQYLSLFALEDSIVSITSVAYPLIHQHISRQDIYTISNEIIKEATITIETGSVLVIQCEDKK